MSVGSDLKRMGRFLEAVEATAGPIQAIEFLEPTTAGASPGVEIEVTVQLGERDQPSTLLPTDARIDASGRIQVELETDCGFVPDIDGVTVTATRIEMLGSCKHKRQSHSDDGETTYDERIRSFEEHNRSTEAHAGDPPQPTIAVCLRAEPVNVAENPSWDEVEARTQRPDGETQTGMSAVGTATTDGGLALTTTDQGADTGESDPRESSENESGDAHGSDTDDIQEAEPDEIDGTNRSVPPFRDPELLAAVYERCETFAEMSEAIDMDVTGETVRRYMIDYGIHEPKSYRSTTDGAETTDAGMVDTEVTDAETTDAETTDAETTDVKTTDAETTEEEAELAAEASTKTEAAASSAHGVEDGSVETVNDAQSDGTDRSSIVATDGFGIHGQVTVDELAETVARSNTVYDVKRELGLGRAETRELLETLDLIDLVVGRITTAEQRNVDRDRILDRLRSVGEPETEPRARSVAH